MQKRLETNLVYMHENNVLCWSQSGNIRIFFIMNGEEINYFKLLLIIVTNFK